VAEIARGSVTDRPWGRTLAALGLRGVTAQLTLVADGKRFVVVFERGAVVAAASPLASDAAVRVALTGHLLSSSQVPEISRRQAQAPDRDEIEVIAELARLGPDHALRLRRRVIAQRAARTFSPSHGEFLITDDAELAVMAGCELDLRAVIYMGARANLSEQRLATELDELGSWFRLKPALDDDLPQFGFTDLEQPVVERLRDGGTIEDLEAFATSFVDPRTVRAVVYSLAAYNACDVEPPRPVSAQARRARPATPPTPGPPGPPGEDAARARTQELPRTRSGEDATQPMATMVPATAASPRSPTRSSAPPAARTSTPPLPRGPEPAATPSHISTRTGTQPMSRSSPATTPPAPPRAPHPTPGSAARPPPTPAPSATRPLPTTNRPPTTPPAALASGSARLRPFEEAIDSSTQHDAARSGPVPRRHGSDPALRPALDAEPQRGGASSTLYAALDAPTQRDGMDPAYPSDPLRAPYDAPAPRDASSPALRPPQDLRGQRERSDPALRPPLDDRHRRDSSSPALRPPQDPRRQREPSDPALRPSLDERTRRDSSSPAPPPAGTPAQPRGSDPALRRPVDDPDVSLPEPVILRVPSSRPPPRPRQLVSTDSPQSHDVKALIAQRLKLLDHGADHFRLLGVAENVSSDALRRAYFGLARQLHPDRLAALGISDDGKHAQRLFAQINSGFAILSDQTRRAHYVDVLRRGGEAAVRAEQARAEELARRILEAEEAFRRGELALKRDQPNAAVTELELAIQLNPDEADYHALLAWSQFCAAPDKMAIASTTRSQLDKAIQRSPQAVAARFFLGRVERMLGRDQEALRYFREVLTAAPGHSDAAAELRVIEARLGGSGGPADRSKR
jgi:hypothetical protein